MNSEATHPTSSLLRTKLLVPRTPRNVIARPRLLAQLAPAAERRLLLVAAPAGFGKTTALCQWLGESGLGTAWVSLDERDNDPTRFWSYVVAGIQTLEPEVGAPALSMLQAPQPPPLEAILTELLNDVIGVPYDFVLVLDDYHAVEQRVIHEGVTFLVDNLPPQMHLAIASRTEPPLPLPLWRARRQLAELDADDLRFTPTEVADFLDRATRLGLTAEQIAALEAATEGWIAALQMAALSMEGEEDLGAFVRSFSGSHRYVFDYLAQEILERQPPELQWFLLETSILDRLTSPLCDAVTTKASVPGGRSQSVLERLEATKLFIVPLDDERRWYRYHNLFAEFLRVRLTQSREAEEIAALHRRAADWYAASELIDAALHHYIAAEDFGLAAGLLERYEEDFFVHSTLISLARWIEALPTAVLEARPRLMMIYAWATLATGRIEKTEETLARIEEAVGATTEALLDDPESLPPEQRNPLLEVTIVRTATGMTFFDLDKVQRIAERLLPYLQEEDMPCLHNTAGELLPILLLNLALAYEFSGKLSDAVPAFAEALETSLRQGNMHVVPLALGHLGQLQAARGRLHQAEEIYRDALQRAEEMSPVPSPLTGNAYAGLGQLYYEWNDLESSEDYLRRGIALGKPWNSWESLLPGYLGLAQIHRVYGRWQAAFSTLDEVEAVCRRAQMEVLLPTVELARLELHAARGELEPVAGWVDDHPTAGSAQPGPLDEEEMLGRGRLLLALERYGEAARLVEKLLPAMEAGERWGRVLQALVLRALACRGLGEDAAALETLERALALAKVEGYVRAFVDRGPVMKQLLERTARESEGSAYVLRLLTAFDAEPTAQRDTVPAMARDVAQPLIEPLTDRELEVMRELAQGLTNREIAERLMVSLNTIKSHTKSIYAKLEVRNRTEAVVRAQELGLLEI